jgi:Tfp pilus assembly protein PilX
VLKPELKINSKFTAAISGLNNEQGVALILVLIMLVLLSILGFTVLATSTSELKIVGNNKSMETAFFAADSAVDYAYTNSNIYNFLIPGTNNTWPASNSGKVLNPDGTATATDSPDKNYNQITIGGNKALVKVDYVETGALPAGMGTEVDAGIGSGGGFKANYYSVSVKGSGPNNAQVEVDSYVARVVPK